MISAPLVKYVLTAAIRDKLLATLIIMILVGGSVSVFLGSSSVAEGAAFALVFGGGGLRMLGVLGLVLFACFYVRRAFEHKEVEFLLSRPISRASFLFSHMLAFMLLAIVVAFAVTVTVMVIGDPHPAGLMIWGLSLMIEYAIMVTAALFFAMVLPSAAGAAMACFGLYILARMMGTLLGIADTPNEYQFIQALGYVLKVISVIVPRLDLMGQTSWLVYGIGGSEAGIEFTRGAGDFARKMIAVFTVPGFIVFQGGVFTGLLMAASAWDFIRKQF